MPALSQSRIGQIAVTCQDVARAKAFYQDVLGLRHLFDAGPTLTFFDCGGVRLLLSNDQGQIKERLSSMLYYLVDDIDGVYRELAAKGVAFGGEPHLIARMPDHELWLAEFRDSEGNVLGLMEERRS